MHTLVLISAGVSLSRTSFPILPGGSPHFHTLGSRHLHKVRSPQPSLPFPALRLGSVSVLQSRSVPQPGFLSSRTTSRPSPFPGPPHSDPGNRTSHLQPKMVAPAHVPSSDHRSSVLVPNPPLPPPGSFSTAARACPTHSHPHWASSTPITAAPRPTGRFARPSPRKDVSNPNEATFPSPAPSTHLK